MVLPFLSRFIARSLVGLLLAAGVAILLIGCAATPPSSSPLPTTVTPATVVVRENVLPTAPVHLAAPTPAFSSPPGPTPPPASTTGTPATATSTPAGLLAGLLRQLKRQTTATPAATPEIIRHRGRIDKIGPIALPTIAPLEPGEGLPPVRLSIPALSLDTPVQRMGWKTVRGVSQWDVVDNAAGHHFNSAYPGERGNVVISGHNNIAGAVFAGVCVIGQPGVAWGLKDAIILTDSAGRTFTYRINGWHRMKEKNASIATRQDNASYLRPTSDARLTLVTCWPPWSNTHRVVVTGVLTDKSLP